jgi:hypothetical protein
MNDQQPGNDWDPFNWHAFEPSGAKSPTLNDEMMPAFWRDWVKKTTAGINAPVGFVLLDLVVSAAGAIGNSRAAVATVDFAQPSVLWGWVVAPSSQRKSTAQNVFNHAIDRFEGRFRQDWRPSDAALKALNAEMAQLAGHKRERPPYEEWLGNASGRLLRLTQSSAESRTAISQRSHARHSRRPPNDAVEFLGIVSSARLARLSDRPTLRRDRNETRAGKRPAGRYLPAGQAKFDDDDRGLPRRVRNRARSL